MQILMQIPPHLLIHIPHILEEIGKEISHDYAAWQTRRTAAPGVVAFSAPFGSVPSTQMRLTTHLLSDPKDPLGLKTPAAKQEFVKRASAELAGLKILETYVSDASHEVSLSCASCGASAHLSDGKFTCSRCHLINRATNCSSCEAFVLFTGTPHWECPVCRSKNTAGTSVPVTRALLTAELHRAAEHLGQLAASYTLTA